MNTTQIGTEFEREAYKILRKLFDKVEWLSKKKQSTFDFKCWKDEESFFADAKIINRLSKPTLSFNQKNADFLIVKINGKIEFILKKEFGEKVFISKKNLKTIKVSEKNWKKLMKLRLDLGLKNLNEVIEKILKSKGGN